MITDSGEQADGPSDGKWSPVAYGQLQHQGFYMYIIIVNNIYFKS